MSHEHHHGEYSSDEELTALLKYMVKHNESHAGELSTIAKKILEDGEEEASNKVKEAVEFFEKGNKILEDALKLMEKE